MPSCQGGANVHADSFAAKGGKVVHVNYADESSLKDALFGVDVVISTLSATALASQLPLAVAAHAAGVQLFVPSEFGPDTEGAKADELTGRFLAAKVDVHTKLREIGIPYTLFATGLFPDHVFISYVSFS